MSHFEVRFDIDNSTEKDITTNHKFKTFEYAMKTVAYANTCSWVSNVRVIKFEEEVVYP